MGISPKRWGREGWKFIHYVALTYPPKPTEADKKKYLNFFLSLQDVLPCEICAMHFRENMKEHPIRLDNNRELFNWTVDVHNVVNKQNGKKVLTYDEAFDELFKKENEINPDILKGVAFSSVVITIITLLSRQYVKKK